MTASSNNPRQLGRVAVLGLGGTGLAVAAYCAGLLGGRVERVDVFGGATSTESDATRALEARGVRMHLACDHVEGAFDLAVTSPGIPPHSDFFRSAEEASAEVIGEPEFAWRESPQRWLAVTGTNGKTTTTTLLTELLRAGGLEASAVGNIGTIATGEVASRATGSWFVAELSSYQLATTSELHPCAAILLNVTPDHLSWHGSMEAYAAAKERIFANLDADDLAVISIDDEWCRAIAERQEGRGLRVCRASVAIDPQTPCAAFVRAGMLVVRLDGEELELLDASELTLKGEHNVQNALCAAAAALETGVALDDVRACLASFAALEHRIEPCGEVGGVRFVNDSKATNTDAVEKALTAFEDGTVVLLAGGHDKGTDLTSLSDAVARSARAVVCFGEAGPRLHEAFAKAGEGVGLVVLDAEHLADALDVAAQTARPGDVVLLSPACSSFDEFSGFEERGRVFKELVAAHVARVGGDA